MVGFLLPSLVLSRLIEKRRKAITNGLPDVLDLLIVCLEAGSSLDQAIMKATAELSLVHPALGEELKMLSTETRAGKPRIDAFKHLEARTRNEDIRSLVAMLVQTDRFGTSVSQALRTFAEVARTKRRQRAEERAAKVGVKMVFPLVLFLFPRCMWDSVPRWFRLERSSLRQVVSDLCNEEEKWDEYHPVSWRRFLVLYLMRRKSRLKSED